MDKVTSKITQSSVCDSSSKVDVVLKPVTDLIFEPENGITSDAWYNIYKNLFKTELADLG